MAVAQSCQDLRSKEMLLRGQVPVTPVSGYSLKSEELHLRLKAGIRHGYQRQGIRQQPARRAKAHAAKSVGISGSSLNMQASSALLGDANIGYLATDSMGPVQLHRNHAAAARCTQGELGIWLQRLPAGPIADATSELCWISFDDPTLTMECLASTAVVRVMKVCHIQLKLCPGLPDMVMLCNVVSV